MSDNLSKADRIKNMRAIKSSNTKLETMVCRALWHKGLRFRKNVKGLYGKPDIAIKKYKVVIFIDSCFWHGCPFHGNIPKTNREYWLKKIERNKQRDIEVTLYYKKNGWNILRVWQHDLNHNFEETINRIYSFINDSKRS